MYGLSEADLEIQARARGMADHLIQYEEQAEAAGGRLPEEIEKANLARALELGLYATNLPRSVGGQGCTTLQQVLVQEQGGRVTNGIAWCMHTPPAWWPAVANDHQRERWLLPTARGEMVECYAITEEHAGSDARGIRAEAVRDGDVYRLSGTKWFVTDGDIASYFLVLAWAVDGLERQPTLFIVDKDSPGVEMTDDPDFTHNFPYRHPEFTFTKTPVPRENILGERGRGFELTGEWFIEERVHIAARCVGACDRLIELGTDWALHREQFGGRIFDHQAVSFALADCAAEVTAARLLTYYVGWLADTGADRKLVHHKAAMAKLVASETAGRVADRVVQIFGGRGYMRENPAERLWRELRVDRIWEGTSEIQRLIIARGLERRGPATLLRL